MRFSQVLTRLRLVLTFAHQVKISFITEKNGISVKARMHNLKILWPQTVYNVSVSACLPFFPCSFFSYLKKEIND